MGMQADRRGSALSGRECGKDYSSSGSLFIAPEEVLRASLLQVRSLRSQCSAENINHRRGRPQFTIRPCAPIVEGHIC
jgi:hypothetical protein